MSKKNSKHHILITGTGRTGTTFLVKLLTLLDIDTGFTKEYLPINKDARAGLEYQGLGGNLPYLIKNPKLMWQLPELVKNNPVVIDHILLPVREIHAAAESRRKNLEGDPNTIDPRDVIGGLEGVVQPEEQEEFFLEKIYQFLEFVSTYQIPLTLLQYPRLVLDGEYLYHKIHSLFSDISKDRFLHVFKDITDPSIVHQYTEGDAYELEYDDSENIKQFYNVENTVPADLLQLRPELQQLRTNFLLKEKKERQLQRQIDNLQKQNDHKDQVIAKKDQAIAKKDQAIAHYRKEFYSVYTSRSWRYTTPLRKIGTLIRRVLRLPHKPRIRAVIKRAYFMLPAFIRKSRLTENLKNRFKSKEMI